MVVQPERGGVEVGAGQRRVAGGGAGADLRVGAGARGPPRTRVVVEGGAQVKQAVRVFEAVLDSQE